MRPEVHRVAEDLYEQLLPLAYDDEELDWPLLKLCAAITHPYAELDDLVRDSDEGVGWSALMDADRTPASALGFTGQLVGVRLRPGLSEAEQRQRIKDTAGLKRGTVAAIAGAARQHLTGSLKVTLRERDGSPYQLTVITYTSETPDEDLVLKALLEQKPAGLVLTYTVLDGQTWDQLRDDDGGRTWDEVEATFDTWDDVRGNIP